MYSIKEIFYTLQGEGANAGRAAIFCRFTGCNLWSGREKDRDRAVCKFCDTDFVGTDGTMGGQYKTAEALVEAMQGLWPDNQKKNKFVVFTGGEPILQLDSNLIKKIKSHGFRVAVETNGTLPLPKEIDWVCVSPKIKSKLIVKRGNEIKVVFPQKNIVLSEYEKLNFQHFYIQPLENRNVVLNTKKSIKYVLKNPKWKLSVQSHKFLKIK